MTTRTFRDMLTRRPFEPVRLVMSSGQSYEIRHPEMAFLSRTAIYIGVGDVEEGVPAEYRICSFLHVTAIEPLQSAASA